MTNPSDQTDQMLKACPAPWCNGPAHAVKRNTIASGKHWIARCVRCGLSTPEASSKAEAIAAWSTRSPDSAVLVGLLEEAADDLALTASFMKNKGHNYGTITRLERRIRQALASFHKGVSDAG